MFFKAGKLIAALTAAGIIAGTAPCGGAVALEPFDGIDNADTSPESFNWIDYADTSWYSKNIFASSNSNDYCIDISTPEQLAGIAKLVNDGEDISGLEFNLTNDIILDDNDMFDDIVKEWTPIGVNSEKPFSGVFNGNSYTIYGLNIRENRDYNGLFGYVKCSSVKNLAFEKGKISSGINVGVVSGSAEHSTFENCYSDISILNKAGEGDANCGGIVGNSKDNEYENCISIGTTTNKSVCAENNVGGIVGCSVNDTYNRCASEGFVAGYSQDAVICVGGICGKAVGCSISEAFSANAVVAKAGDGYVGGIVGLAQDAEDITTDIYRCISRSFSNLNSSIGYAGGITGYGGNIATSCHIGDVTSSDVGKDAVLGGIAGGHADIENCYCLSTVYGSILDGADESGFITEPEIKETVILMGNIIGEKDENDMLVDTYYIDGNKRFNHAIVGAVGNDDSYNELERCLTEEEIVSDEFAQLMGENFCKVDNYPPLIKGYRFIEEIENPGDANEDGCVDIFDVAAVQKHLVNDNNSLNPLGKSLADVDNEAGITIADAVRINRYVVGMKPDMWHDGACRKGNNNSTSGSVNTTLTDISKDENDDNESVDFTQGDTIT